MSRTCWCDPAGSSQPARRSATWISALWLVAPSAPEPAALAAKYLIVDDRASQSMYALTDHLLHTDPIVERFERWARSRLDRPFSLPERHQPQARASVPLARRLQAVFGKSPLKYVHGLRVEQPPCGLIHTTNQSVDEVAVLMGYEDGVVVRTLLRRGFKVEDAGDEGAGARC